MKLCENCGIHHDGKFSSGRFCCKKCARSFSTKFMSDESKKKRNAGLENGRSWNKQPEKEKRFCSTCNKPIIWNNKSGYCAKCRYKSAEYKLGISERSKTNPNCGGYKKGSGRGKQGWYQGYWCQSTWELVWVIYQLDHQEEFIKCKEFFEYEFRGEKKRYYPDFIWNNQYVEIKGWRYPGTQEKLDQFPKDKKLLLIEGKKAIKPFIEYVKEKYGHYDFASLYQNRRN